jgi:hypothetical protein
VHDLAVRRAAVERERLVEPARAVEDPAAQRRLGQPPVAQVLVAQLLEAVVRLGGVLRPVDVEAEDGEGEQDEDPAQSAQPAVRRGRAEPLAHLGREVGGRDRRERRALPPQQEQRREEHQRRQRHARHVDQTQQRRLLLGNVG